MDQLSSVDASFFDMETPETPMNMGSVTIFAPPADKLDAVFESFRDHTAARLDLLPSYRRILHRPPLSIDRPDWVIADEVDLDYHIRHLALPSPGTIEQLRSMIGELHAIPLDRAQPLWQYTLIDGLEGGGFAVYLKVHHATMDGMAGMAALPVIFDFSPEPPPLAAPPRRPSPAETSGLAQRLGGALDSLLERQQRLLEAGPKLATAVANVVRRAPATLRLLPDVLRLAPKTLLNVSISGERSYGTGSISLSQVKHVAKSNNVTVNDVVLTVCAGALRRYLTARKALPSAPLIAAVPVSLREPGHTEMTIQVGVVLSTLATDVVRPLRRLATVAAAAQQSKGRLMDVKPTLSQNLPSLPLMTTGLAWLAGYTRFFDIWPNVMNLWISNVPGPHQPMYCAGARALHFFPVSIPNHGCALNITAQSYLDSIDFGLTACRKTVPDVQTIADYIIESFTELSRASDDAGHVDIIEIAAREVSASDLKQGRPTSETDGASREAVAEAAPSILIQAGAGLLPDAMSMVGKTVAPAKPVAETVASIGTEVRSVPDATPMVGKTVAPLEPVAETVASIGTEVRSVSDATPMAGETVAPAKPVVETVASIGTDVRSVPDATPMVGTTKAPLEPVAAAVASVGTEARSVPDATPTMGMIEPPAGPGSQPGASVGSEDRVTPIRNAMSVPGRSVALSQRFAKGLRSVGSKKIEKRKPK
jgi:diacylglycerol O-acyltransferase